jgi:hypothetical protein
VHLERCAYFINLLTARERPFCGAIHPRTLVFAQEYLEVDQDSVAVHHDIADVLAQVFWKLAQFASFSLVFQDVKPSETRMCEDLQESAAGRQNRSSDENLGLRTDSFFWSSLFHHSF